MKQLVLEKVDEELARNAFASISRIQIVVSRNEQDTTWDSFLAGTPGGDHVQTSMWARLKAPMGWQATRLIIQDCDEIIGGAQILTRTFKKRLRIGYISGGPVFRLANAESVAAFLTALKNEVESQKLHCVIIQPPDIPQLRDTLIGSHYRPVYLGVFPVATVVIDLARSLDELLMAMKPKKRKYVRRSIDRGVHVRRGSRDDLGTFYRLSMATANRKGFPDFPIQYYERLWDIFSAGDHIQLFVAEVDEKPVSASLRINFGDTVWCKRRGWSGEFANAHPNEALEWAGIQWAKAAGYRYYDLEGINQPDAEYSLRGEPIPNELADAPSSYKLGWGGNVQMLPGALVYFSNPLIRWGHRVVYPKVASWKMIHHLAERVKMS
jgi:lipid II:glycine glycyltransferase (peptidoglycan interpeptide bridge formation enzyme)